ncbi:hypothetical protein FOC4_g10010869 [Fusarium odoratissimum]|uniref:Uncharacterized protein n=1 Tax=Fusarium oxysporum f. sp. cubense (strain race 4) TaxID=2502994 RepID=N1RFS5_FUSC4|nr:hypothetical protein FOC4_g10010869 [Fusarium odoratissimum]
MATDLHKPDPVPRPRRLARKRDVDELSQLTSGTLTVTVAPDPTCGFTNNDEAVWVCPGGRPCTWEKGQINRFWCAWQQIYTTCLDSTAIFDPAICNSECRTNTRNAIAGCPSSEKPFCVTLELGNGIFSYGMTASATVEASSSSTQISTSATSIPGDSPNVGVIVGGVVGGLGVIGLVALGLFGLILLRRRRGNMAAPSEYTPGLAQQPHSPSKVTSNTQFVETQAGAYDVSTHSYAAPVQSNGPTPQLSPSTSSPLNKAPSPGTLYSYELDEARTDHHRGSMYEMR